MKYFLFHEKKINHVVSKFMRQDWVGTSNSVVISRVPRNGSGPSLNAGDTVPPLLELTS